MTASDNMTTWPQKWIDTLGREPRVGDWYAFCCDEDLHRIESQDELREIIEMADEHGWGAGMWLSREAALEELLARSPWPDAG